MTYPIQLLRTRIMPSAIHSRNALTFQQSRGPKQDRYSSTGQELKSMQNDERIAAMLHGEKRKSGEKESPERPSPVPAASTPSHHSATLSRHNAQTDKHPEQPRNPPQRQAQREQPHVRTGKRKALASLSQRPATRQRGNALELKDEAYIRSTMQMPTPQDYPDAPRDFFKNHKTSMFNIAQNLATCRSEFTALSHDAHQCTAYYDSAMHNQAVAGEGRTKASLSVS